jgi:hypothetical protein
VTPKERLQTRGRRSNVPISDYFPDVESLPVVEELLDDESDEPWSSLLGAGVAVLLVSPVDELPQDELSDDVLSAGALMLSVSVGLFVSFP